MMTRTEYVEAVNAIIKHDEMVSRVHNVSRDLAREVGDDFGGVAIVPETGLRRLAIELIEAACGDASKQTSYLLDEGRTMEGGGRIHYPDGEILPVTTASECYTVIERDNE